MSSIVVQMLTGSASGAPKGATGAAGLFAPAGAADAEASGGFEALLAAPAPRPSDAQVASLPEIRLADAAADGGAPPPVESLAAVVRAMRLEAGAGGEGGDAETVSVSPQPDAAIRVETQAASMPEVAGQAQPIPDAAPAPAEPLAAVSAEPSKTESRPATGSRPAPAATPLAGLTGSDEGATLAAAVTNPPASVQAGAAATAPSNVDGADASPAASAVARPIQGSAEGAGSERPIEANAPPPPAAKAEIAKAAARPDPGKPAPAAPQPAEPAMAAAADPAAFKRAAVDGDAGLELRDARGASDIAAMRALGEQVRAAARAAGSEPASKPGEDAPKAGAAPSGVDAAAAKPAPATPPAPGSSLPPGLAAALMSTAAPGSLAAPLAGEAGLEGAPDGEAELSLEAGGSRADARAEVNRQSLPQAANAQAAARFQPQTVQTLAARIAARAVEGGRVFEIRLDPAELGRVEVRLELGTDNSVRALLSAERADTLAELQRSARDLEKALAEAGLDLAEDGLSFSLSDDGAPDGGDERDAPRFSAAVWSRSETPGAEATVPDAPVRFYGFELAARRGLDVRT